MDEREPVRIPLEGNENFYSEAAKRRRERLEKNFYRIQMQTMGWNDPAGAAYRRKLSRKEKVQRLLEKDGPLCKGNCGKELTIETATIDHIVPRSKGGGNHFRNLQLMCVHCNQKKGNHYEPQ